MSDRARGRRMEALVRLVSLCFFSAFAVSGWAENARSLPSGKYHLKLQFVSGKVDKVFDTDGESRSFDAIAEDSLVAAGVPTEVAGVYRIDATGSVSVKRQDIYLEYGLTNNSDLGVWVQHLNIVQSSGATLVREPGWSALPAAQQIGIEGAVAKVDNADRSAAGWGDTVLGLKHRLLGDNYSRHRFAYYLGLRLPTGRVADPRDPTDLSLGDGQVDAGIWLSYDYQPTDNVVLNVHTRHEYQFPGKRDVLDPVDPSRTTTMEFQPGFYNYLELHGRFAVPQPAHDWLFELKSYYEQEGETREQQYDSASGAYSGSLKRVEGTNSRLWWFEPRIGISLFPQKIPMTAYVIYGMPVAGKNRVGTEYAGVIVNAYW